MGTLFGVEVVQIRLMLEVVGVYLTVLDDLVGDHIVVVLLNIQRDALGGKDLLAHLQHLAVGSGSSGTADGLAVQSVIIHSGIIAVGGVLHNGHHGALVGLVHEVLHLLALQGSSQSLDLRLLLIAVLAHQNVDVSRRAVLHGQCIGHGVQTGRDGVVGVDDGVVLVLQDVGHLSGLHLVHGDVQGVLLDVILGGGQAGICLQLEEAVLLQQGQGAGLVGGIVGHSHLDLIQLSSGRGCHAAGCSGGRSSGRRTTAGSQGSGCGCHTGNFQKIATSNHSFVPSLLFSIMYCGPHGTFPRTALNGRMKKCPRPYKP